MVLAYYSLLALQGSVDYKTLVKAFVLAKYTAMAGVMFAINARNGTSPTYYMNNSRFDKLSGGLLFCLLVKVSKTLRHVRLCIFALRMGADPFLTAFTFYECGEVDS